MAITRMAISTPSAYTNTLAYTADREALVSVIATNKASTAATVRIWVQPYLSSTESQYAFLSYDVVIPANNSLETFRFPIKINDDIYVRASSANVSFSINGVYEEKGRQFTYVSATTPASPVIGDTWYNTSLATVSYYDGSNWNYVNTSTGLNNISTQTTLINTTNTTTIDQFSSLLYKTAEYIVQYTQGSNTRSSKIMVSTNGTVVNWTEYAILNEGAQLIPITNSASMSSTNVLLSATSSSLANGNITAKIHRVVINA